MDTYDKQSGHLSIIDAVETLSEIADLDFDHGVGIAHREVRETEDEGLSSRTVYWLDQSDPEKSLSNIKDTFRVILNYLRHYYRDEVSPSPTEQNVEGIKTIMVLVGEAAKKLDKYTHVFHLANSQSVTETQEYRSLQEFYQSKIAYRLDEGKLGQWLLALSKTALTRRRKDKLHGRATQQTKHMFVDLDAVKKDTEYELFFIRKEDGSRFFNPRLLRNMKLVSDFGGFFSKDKEEESQLYLPEWSDKYYHHAAKDILKELGSCKNKFYKNAFKYRDNELVQSLSNALMALMMAANPRNSMKLDSLKSCEQYFCDFQLFLRRALHSREYAKLLAYPSSKADGLGSTLLQTVHALCRGLYFNGNGYKELASEVSNLLGQIQRQKSVDQQCEPRVWKKLHMDYNLINKAVKGQQNAALVKILDALQEGNCRSFDPLDQKTMQTQLFYLVYGSNKVLDVRMGCPIVQEYINKAMINNEFKGALRSFSKESSLRNILLINVQNRTSWKDHSRCAILEELQDHSEFNEVLAVVTIAKDTDFYNQEEPYDQDNKAEVFFSHFKEHFGDESSGYYFPEPLDQMLDDVFVDGILNAIHHVFYRGKNMLLKEHRLDFIEIFDALLTLKIIEAAQPDSFSLVCKDGIDSSSLANGMLYAFLKLVNSAEGMSDEDWHMLNRLLHLPALMVRERLVHQDKFQRFINALKAVEAAREEHGAEAFIHAFREAFQPFFKTEILKSQIVNVAA